MPKKNDTKIKKSTQVKVPVIFVFIFSLAASLTTIFISGAVLSSRNKEDNSKYTESGGVEYNIKRIPGFKLTRPLFSAKPSGETAKYSGLKKEIYDFILKNEYEGIISSASVYFRDFDKADWFSIEEHQRYIPASLYKIPMMISLLKYSEEHSGFLDLKIVNDLKTEMATGSKQIIKPEHQIEFGKTYSIREMIESMIVYSDNYAFTLLRYYLPEKDQNILFDELGLPRPNYGKESDPPITVSECSSLLESLINSTLLTTKNSEYALNLLSRTTFHNGIEKSMSNPDIVIAHKFGEGGTFVNKELHETAIIYIKNKPYLLTIMTRGKEKIDHSKLAMILQGIGEIVYKELIK